MKNTSFKSSKIIQCRFTDTILEKACFEDVDLAGSTFHNCDLRNANFVNAINYIISPVDNKIKGAKFSFPECMGLVKSLDVIIID